MNDRKKAMAQLWELGDKLDTLRETITLVKCVAISLNQIQSMDNETIDNAVENCLSTLQFVRDELAYEIAVTQRKFQDKVKRS